MSTTTVAAPKRPERRLIIWHSGPLVRKGLDRYVHLIRSADDPKELARKDRKGHQTSWKDHLGLETRGQWKRAILDLLRDQQPRTFNHIMLELTGGLRTADVAFEMAPDKALWELVGQYLVAHTSTAPVLFRAR